MDTFKDKRGLVRTVRVAFRKRDKREPLDSYWKKPLSEEIVAIQRLSLLQAADEPAPSGNEKDHLPIDIEKRVVKIKASLVQSDPHLRK